MVATTNDKALALVAANKERVDIHPSVDLRGLSSFTVEAWVKVDPLTTSPDQRAFTIRQGGSQQRIRFAFTPYRGKLRFELARQDGTNDTNYTHSLTWEDRWHHVAFAVNGGESTYWIYVDGSEVQTGHLEGFGTDSEDQALTISDTQSQGVYIGASTTNGSNFTYWGGKIDVLRLWSSTLSDSQILQNMRTFIEEPESTSGLLGEWRLESDGSSSISAVTRSDTEGVWTGTLKRNGSNVTDLWTNDRPFVEDGQADTTPPTRPAIIATQNITSTSFNIFWSMASDDVYVQLYEVTVSTTNNFSSPVSGWSARQVGRVLDVDITGLEPNTNYYPRVRAIDANGNASEFKELLTATTTLATGDLNVPSQPLMYAASNVGAISFDLSWSTPYDNVAVSGYKVDVAKDSNFTDYLPLYRNRDVGNVNTITVNNGVPPDSTLYARVRAYDAAENESNDSNVIEIHTIPIPDIQAPTVVETLPPSAMASDGFTARWLPSIDNVGVEGYYLDLSTSSTFSSYVTGFNSKDIGDVEALAITGLTPETTYYYRLRAYDAADNVSGNSEHVETVTTLSRSFEEEGLEIVDLVPTKSASLMLDDTLMTQGTLYTEFRHNRPIGQYPVYPANNAGIFMFDDNEGPYATNIAQGATTQTQTDDARYMGAYELGGAGPSGFFAFGDTTQSVKLVDDGIQHGYIELPSSLPPLVSTDGEILRTAVWYRLDAGATGVQPLVEFSSSDNGDDAVRLYITSDKHLALSYYVGDVLTHTFTHSETITTGEWHYALMYVSKETSSWEFSLETETYMSWEYESYATSIPVQERTHRYVGRSRVDDTYLQGSVFGLAFGVEGGYLPWTDAQPITMRYAVYGFSLRSLNGVDPYAYNLHLPVYTQTAKPIDIYLLDDEAWSEEYVSRDLFDSHSNKISVTTTGNAIDVDVSSLMETITTDNVTFLVGMDFSTVPDTIVLGKHNTAYSPVLSVEVDYSAATEPRRIDVTAEREAGGDYVISVEGTWVGDSNKNVVVTLQSKTRDEDDWTTSGASYNRTTKVLTSTTTVTPSEFGTTIYDFQIVFSDEDGIIGQNVLGASIEIGEAVQDVLAVGSLTLTATDKRIDIVQRYSGDDNNSATAVMEWKRSDYTTWSEIPFSWSRSDKTLTARILALQPHTSYDVRTTFSDTTDTVYGTNPVTESITTNYISVNAMFDPFISFDGFVLHGPTAQNIGVSEHDAFSAPNRDVVIQALPRVHGEIEQSDMWRRKEIKMSGFISGNTRQELANAVSGLRHALSGRRKRLVIDTLASESYYYIATVDSLNIPQVGAESARRLKWDATFMCGDPFRYDTEETVIDSVTMYNNDTITLTNTGDIECDAYYTIRTPQVLQAVTVTVTNLTTGVRCTPLASFRVNEVVEIDTARLVATKNGIGVDFAGGLPRLARGANEIRISYTPNTALITEEAFEVWLSVRRRHRYF